MAQFNLHNKQYCVSLTEYKRLQTQEVWIGHIPMGAGHPIRRQSMTNTDTNDTWATVNQIKRIADAGAEYARMTTRTINEAENLNNIKETLFRDNYRIPLIADVHFNNRIAEKAAVIVDKVRINPGNYAVRFSRKREPEEIRKQFIHLIDLCKSNDTALRIGVNHGSLSRRIMDLYGDTPRGMVESALEYIKICEEQNFHNVVISLKSSNTRVMVQANRLLMHEMLKRERIYPLHLGVTEAGEGEDGRIKSAVGIGALLVDGIGDTIRVSLTEAPEKEIPVAKTLSEYMLQKHSDVNLPELTSLPIDPFSYSTRTSSSAGFIGGEDPPVVIGKKRTRSALKPDLIISHSSADEPLTSDIPLIQPYNIWLNTGQPENHYPLFNSIALYLENREEIKSLCFIETSIQEFDQIECLRNAQNAVLIIRALSENPTFEQRRFIFELMNKNIDLPVIVHKKYNENLDDLRLKAASDLGLLFLDGLADGVFLENYIEFPEEELLSISFGILQASRSRIYKTEFISCPGCGRTQFNLEKTAEKIRERMGHLKGLKIAIMGCIVNGPGEMADADYGYVGAGPGKITLYRNKEVVKRNIPEEKALEELEKLIQEYGDWEIRKK
ncbi:MAG: (E)-4-hydroxy-3-methylbut-2-enyl-diphosphate synthase [Bacteroidales bacterium]